jgi:hypothetical protein
MKKSLRQYLKYVEILRRVVRYRKPKYRYGSFVRWLIEDAEGNSVYCDYCGNIANAIKWEYFAPRLFGGIKLRVPICKRHVRDLLDADLNYELDDSSFCVYPRDRRA